VTVPDDAQPLDMEPIDDGKRPTLWKELSYRQRTEQVAPAPTRRAWASRPVESNGCEIRTTVHRQVLVSVLRKPSVNDDGEFEVDDDGHYQYEKGLIGSAHADRQGAHPPVPDRQGKRPGQAPPRPPPAEPQLTPPRTAAESWANRYQHPGARWILRVPRGTWASSPI
jgi:hypothetical protein